MRRFFAALLGMLIGYPVFAFVGYGAIGLFSGNHFDGSVEASMTAAFVFGPAGAIIGLIAGIIVGKKKPTLNSAPRCGSRRACSPAPLSTAYRQSN
jgi:hypothetical protein